MRLQRVFQIVLYTCFVYLCLQMNNFTKISTCLYRYKNDIYYGRKKVKGRIVIKSLETSDPALAKRKLKQWIEGLEGFAGEISLKALCDLFMKTRSHRKAKTLEGYQRAISWLKNYLGENTLVHHILPLDISTLFAKSSQDYSGSTHNHLTETINLIFELALNNGFVYENPVSKVEKNLRRKRVIRKKPAIPTQEQFEILVSHIRNVRFSDTRQQSSDLVEFLGLAALGQAEAEQLRWEDVDWNRERINVQRRKTEQHFFTPFFPWLKIFLIDLWNRSGKPTQGRIFSVRCAKASLRNACKALGYPKFSPRSLRQYGIVRQLRAGLHYKLVAKYQGHQDGGVLITKAYSEVIGADDEAYEKKLVDSLKI